MHQTPIYFLLCIYLVQLTVVYQRTFLYSRASSVFNERCYFHFSDWRIEFIINCDFPQLNYKPCTNTPKFYDRLELETPVIVPDYNFFNNIAVATFSSRLFMTDRQEEKYGFHCFLLNNQYQKECKIVFSCLFLELIKRIICLKHNESITKSVKALLLMNLPFSYEQLN